MRCGQLSWLVHEKQFLRNWNPGPTLIQKKIPSTSSQWASTVVDFVAGLPFPGTGKRSTPRQVGQAPRLSDGWGTRTDRNPRRKNYHPTIPPPTYYPSTYLHATIFVIDRVTSSKIPNRFAFDHGWCLSRIIYITAPGNASFDNDR